MNSKQRLLLDGLDRHEAHVRSRHGLADRLRIARITLVRLHVGLHELRRHQSDGVPQLAQLARPEVSATASFHPDQAWHEPSEKAAHLGALQRAAQDHLASLVDPMHLKYVFCQINADSRNVPHGRSCRFKWLLDTSTLAQLMPCRAGASMPLNPVAPECWRTS
jgi:hypothetical protein